MSSSPKHAPSEAGKYVEWPKSPYKGLAYFTPNDAPLFSQRDQEAAFCAALLDDFSTRVLVLHGTSGAGKSSFVRAGLLPLLAAPNPDSTSFAFLRNEQAQPWILRSTEDPIGRIHDMLRTVAATDERIPAHVRTKMLKDLGESLSADRADDAEEILQALTEMGSSSRELFILAIDQAEEVLTLRETTGVKNCREAFFMLLEEICLRRLSLRVVVILRTEYYGQFCSFFRFPPTTRISAAVHPRVGMVDFLLRGLYDPTQIAGAIILPTSSSPVHGISVAPKEIYRFSYKNGLAERISADLVKNSGVESTLPAMQIVCRKLYEGVVVRRRQESGHDAMDYIEITELDYERIGEVSGALQSYINDAVGSALREAGSQDSNEETLELWKAVICSLLGKQEGGAVTTLIQGEEQLLQIAQDLGLTGDLRRVVRALTSDKSQLLRLVTYPGRPGERYYSLGHDSLGPPLAQWSEAHSERIEARALLADEKKKAEGRRERTRWRVAFAAICSAFAMFYLWTSLIGVKQQSANVLAGMASQQSSANLRARLLLLVSASKSVSTFPWVHFASQPDIKQSLKNTLLRAPIFVGRFDAVGLNDAGTQLVFLDAGRVATVNLADIRAPKEIGRLTVETDSMGFGFVQPAAGFPNISDGGGGAFVVRTPGSSDIWSWATVGSAPIGPIPISSLVQAESELGVSPPQIEIDGGKLRATRYVFRNGAIAGLRVASIKIMPGPSFNNLPEPFSELDWRPQQVNALFPILGEDCDDYAFIGRGPGASIRAWYGTFGDKASQVGKPKNVLDARGGQPSIAIARRCGFALFRTVGHDKVPGQLAVIGVGSEHAFSEQAYDIPKDFDRAIPAAFPQIQSALGAASFDAVRGGRAAWLIPEGLAVLDIDPHSGKAQSILTGMPGQELRGEIDRTTGMPSPQGEVLQLGLEASGGIPKLTFSRDGDFLTLTVADPASSHVDVRVFDLRLGMRLAALTKADLQAEACRLASSLPGGSAISPHELGAEFVRNSADQPCVDATLAKTSQ